MCYIALVGSDDLLIGLVSDFLNKYSKEENEVFNTEFFSNGILFLENYSQSINLIFIDVEMPDFDGLDTAKQLRKIDPNVKIILMSNTADAAVRGYDIDAAEFMLKPLEYIKFAVKLKKTLNFIKKTKQDSFLLRHDGDLLRIYYSKVLFLEVQNHWLIYKTVDGDYKIRATLNSVKDQFVAHGFVQCNKCYLINLDYVEKISGHVVEVGKHLLQVSIARKKKLLDSFERHMKIYG